MEQLDAPEERLARPQLPIYPTVISALFCREVLEEASGLVSLIRIVDTVHISGDFAGPPDADAPEDIDLIDTAIHLVVAFRGLPTDHDTLPLVRLWPPENATPLLLVGPHVRGKGQFGSANMRAQLNLGIRYPGVFWFEILVDDRVLSAVPVEVQITWTRVEQTATQD